MPGKHFLAVASIPTTFCKNPLNNFNFEMRVSWQRATSSCQIMGIISNNVTRPGISKHSLNNFNFEMGIHGNMQVKSGRQIMGRIIYKITTMSSDLESAENCKAEEPRVGLGSRKNQLVQNYEDINIF